MKSRAWGLKENALFVDRDRATPCKDRSFPSGIGVWSCKRPSLQLPFGPHVAVHKYKIKHAHIRRA